MRYRVIVAIEDEFVDTFEAGSEAEAEKLAKEQLMDFLDGAEGLTLYAKAELIADAHNAEYPTRKEKE
jgi:hypothetical protein